MLYQSLTSLILGLCVTSVTATTYYDFDNIKSNSKLQWYPCKPSVYCARLSVPLDYSKPSGHQASIALVKIPAKVPVSSSDYKGSLMVQSGGTGTSGILFALKIASGPLSNLVSEYDVIGFDVRGVGYTLPQAQCLDPDETQIDNAIFYAYGNPGATNDTIYEAWSLNYAFNRICENTIGGENQAGQHMTTAIISNDMISIADAIQAIGSQGYKTAPLVNYWGFGYYATQIGQTFAALYSNRVGRFVLDGVVDPYVYSNVSTLEGYEESDAILGIFFKDCFKARSKCGFYFTAAKSDRDLQARFDLIIDQLEVTPAVVITTDDGIKGYSKQIPGSITSDRFRSAIYSGLFGGYAAYPAIVELLLGIENTISQSPQGIFYVNRSDPAGTLLSYPQLVETQSADAKKIDWATKLTNLVTIYFGAATRAAICSDAPSLHNETAAQFIPYLQTAYATLHLIPGRAAINRFLCTTWQIRPTVNYDGPFTGNTKTPILFISNKYDPNTPYANGPAAVKRYPGSRLLTVDAVGSTSLNTNSTCAYATTAQYFKTGALPKAGTVCQAGAVPFA